MNTNSLQTPYIVISGVVLLTIIAVFTVFNPLVSSIRTQQEHIRSLDEELTRKTDFLQSLDQKRQQLAAQKADENKLDVMLPIGESYDDILRVIAGAAAESGNVVAKVNNQAAGGQAAINAKRARGEEVTIPADVVPLVVSVGVQGTYQQLRAFLNNLEKSPRLSDVQKIVVKRTDDQTDQLSTDLLIQFYFRPQVSL